MGLQRVTQATFQIAKTKAEWPWLVWLSGLSAGLQTKRSPVQLPVRAHAWVAGQVLSWGTREATDWCFSRTCMFLSLSFFLPSPLSNKNKQNL